MRTLLLWTTLLTAPALASDQPPAPAPTPEPAPEATAEARGTVTLRITDVETTDGQMLVVLFDDAEGYPNEPDKAFRKQRIPATVPVTTATFTDLPPGTYAAFAVHDVNGNDEVDLKWPIPMPKEPVGASNDAKGTFGPPPFKRAAFEVPAGTVEQRFRIKAM